MKRLYHPAAYDTFSPTGSWWEQQPGASRFDAPQVEADHQVDIAIIGAGFTGLSAALHLARDHDCEPMVVDAAPVGWGASGRNAGFCCLGGTKLADAAFARRYGEQELALFYQAQHRAVELVAEVIGSEQIDAEVYGSGEYCMAHNQRAFTELKQSSAYLQRVLGQPCPIVQRDELETAGLETGQFAGALHVPVGFGLNPRCYVIGLANAVLRAGGRIFCRSPVTRVTERADGRYHLETATGAITAERLILAGNGYNTENVVSWMAGRYLPVLSHVMVTEPMSDADFEMQGWHTETMAYDSRHLLHYFRRLPSGRFLLGTRGATDADPASQRAMGEKLRRQFESMFPAWAHVPTACAWSGLICLSRNLTPHIGRIGDWRQAWTALAYHGSGVAMATYAGRQLAYLAAGKAVDAHVPKAMNVPLRRFPVPALRRHGLSLAYRYYAWRDR